MTISPENAHFTTKTALPLRGVTPDTLHGMHARLRDEYGLTDLQIAEAAGFSMAMVVRFALGLSALEGQVCALVNDSLSGAVALTTLRHLVNGGSQGVVLFVGKAIKEKTPSELFTRVLQPLEQMNVSMEYWHEEEQHSLVQDLLVQCHNSICGLYRPDTEQSAFEASVVEILNEISTPIHAIECPLGICETTGKKSYVPLFASSTLSLGAPLVGLQAGGQYAGRHYLCDISFTPEIYKSAELNYPPLFAEQPVIQILPNNGES